MRWSDSTNSDVPGSCADGLSLPISDPTPSTMRVAGVGNQRYSLSSTNRPEGVEGVAHTGKARGNRVGVVLTERDREILKLCFEQQFLLMKHVRHFFPNAKERRVEVRVLKLIRSGFVRREFYPEFGQVAVLRLTNRGVQVAQLAGARNLKPAIRINPKTLDHDAKVTSARLRLLQFWNANFIPERAIKAKNIPEVPDGIFFFPSGRGVALEVENSDKGRTRFLRLLERWKETPSIALVLFVVSHPKLHGAILRNLQTAACEQAVGVVRYDDLMTGKPLVWTTHGERDLFAKTEPEL
jgi:hypothetical protein